MWRSSLSQFHSKHCRAWVTWENNFPSRKVSVSWMFASLSRSSFHRRMTVSSGYPGMFCKASCSCPCSIIPFMGLCTKALLGLCFLENASSGAGPGLEQGLLPLGVLRSVQLQGRIIFGEHFGCPGCCGWCGSCFVLLEGLFSCTVCLFLLGSVKGWAWHLWCWPLQDLFSCFCDGRRPSREWLWGLCMSCAFLSSIALPLKFPKHTAFSSSHGLLPLNSFLDMFCWKMVISLWVDFCQNINLTYICSAENSLSYGIINKWATKYGAGTRTLEVEKV